MGVDFSKEAARPPLSLACVAEVSRIDTAQFHAFSNAIQKARAPLHRHDSTHSLLEPTDDHNSGSDHAADSSSAAWRAYDLTAASFEHALALSGVAELGSTVLERMFTIMDRSGDEVVHSLELLVAVALLVQGPFASKLDFAVGCLLDGLHDTPLAPKHVLFLISTMTTVANYFGDPLLPLPVLEGIADDAFQELSCAADFDPHQPVAGNESTRQALVQALATHPYVQEFISQDRSTWSPR